MNPLGARIALLSAPGTAMLGHEMHRDSALALVRERFPGRQFCIIREWIWIDLELPEAVCDELLSTQRQPVMLYGDVVIDSLGRFDEGDWVRSTPLVSFTQGCLFETRDTVYCLLGHGVRKSVELSTMVKIFRASKE